MIDDTFPRNHWPLARVIDSYEGHNGATRKVKLKAYDGLVHHRPVHKLILLLD